MRHAGFEVGNFSLDAITLPMGLLSTPKHNRASNSSYLIVCCTKCFLALQVNFEWIEDDISHVGIFYTCIVTYTQTVIPILYL